MPVWELFYLLSVTIAVQERGPGKTTTNSCMTHSRKQRQWAKQPHLILSRVSRVWKESGSSRVCLVARDKGPAGLISFLFYMPFILSFLCHFRYQFWWHAPDFPLGDAGVCSDLHKVAENTELADLPLDPGVKHILSILSAAGSCVTHTRALRLWQGWSSRAVTDTWIA